MMILFSIVGESVENNISLENYKLFSKTYENFLRAPKILPTYKKSNDFSYKDVLCTLSRTSLDDVLLKLIDLYMNVECRVINDKIIHDLETFKGNEYPRYVKHYCREHNINNDILEQHYLCGCSRFKEDSFNYYNPLEDKDNFLNAVDRAVGEELPESIYFGKPWQIYLVPPYIRGESRPNKLYIANNIITVDTRENRNAEITVHDSSTTLHGKVIFHPFDMVLDPYPCPCKYESTTIRFKIVDSLEKHHFESMFREYNIPIPPYSPVDHNGIFKWLNLVINAFIDEITEHGFRFVEY